MFDTFYSEISEILYRHMYTYLMKQLSRKEMKLKTKPWKTPEIKTSNNIKNNLKKKKMLTPNIGIIMQDLQKRTK